ncbi:MAG: hypothetical protein Q9169_004087 [Polycauliona sp. 2 TL-2023]
MTVIHPENQTEEQDQVAKTSIQYEDPQEGKHIEVEPPQLHCRRKSHVLSKDTHKRTESKVRALREWHRDYNEHCASISRTVSITCCSSKASMSMTGAPYDSFHCLMDIVLEEKFSARDFPTIPFTPTILAKPRRLLGVLEKLEKTLGTPKRLQRERKKPTPNPDHSDSDDSNGGSGLTGKGQLDAHHKIDHWQEKSE